MIFTILLKLSLIIITVNVVCLIYVHVAVEKMIFKVMKNFYYVTNVIVF